jgi:uncharacterized protein DUF3291
MPIVSVTRLRLRSPRYVMAFCWTTIKVQRAARRGHGNLAVRLRKTAGLAFWTLTSWRDTAAMHSFTMTSPHKEAMEKLGHWCDEAAFGHWEVSTSEVPSWEVAAKQLRVHGQLGKLRHPSPQHKAGEVVIS